MDSDNTQPEVSQLDALIDEMDAQVCLLGRLFAARHGGGHGHGEGAHGQIGALSMPQFMCLRVIATAGPSKMGDLAALLGIKPPAVSAIVDTAEAAGFVTREPDAEDRRITRVAITEAGNAVLLEAERERRETMRRYASVLSVDDIRALIRIQHTLIEAMVAEKI